MRERQREARKALEKTIADHTAASAELAARAEELGAAESAYDANLREGKGKRVIAARDALALAVLAIAAR
jgi:hypothetical protein